MVWYISAWVRCWKLHPFHPISSKPFWKLSLKSLKGFCGNLRTTTPPYSSHTKISEPLAGCLKEIYSVSGEIEELLQEKPGTWKKAIKNPCHLSWITHYCSHYLYNECWDICSGNVGIYHNLFPFSAHPNMKLFISHGGLLGITEAVYEGIPVLGIPVFGDQWANIKKLESLKAGKLLPYLEITEETVSDALKTVLSPE